MVSFAKLTKIIFGGCLLNCIFSSAAFWSAKQQKKILDAETCFDGNCDTLTLTVYDNGNSDFGRSISLTRDECATKMDLGELICPKLDRGSRCALHSRYGSRIDSCSDMKSGDSIFIVPAGRLFIWPTFHVGHVAKVSHISLSSNVVDPSHTNVNSNNNEIIEIETISVEPKVFKVTNFISLAEADGLIASALKITGEAYKLKRSSTGVEYDIDSYRTSENAFDTNSDLARVLKKRVFELLGIFPYEEMMADGLQVLRYNQTTAYRHHLDWIEPTEESPHNFDSASAEGTNRFATLLLYLSDVDDGGETIFTEARLREGDYADNLESTVAYLEAKNISHLFPADSWQRKMVNKCRSPQLLSVKPKKAEAVLFYSQLPDGQPDRSSMHGGCPVLQGQKWAANLWVWNGPRDGYWTLNPATGKNERPKSNHNAQSSSDESGISKSISASFESSDVIGAQLFWGDQFWDTLTQGKGVKVNTFPGHVWNVRLGDDVVVSWVVADDKPIQRFVLSSEDLPSFQ